MLVRILLNGCPSFGAVPLENFALSYRSTHDFDHVKHRPHIYPKMLACTRSTALGDLFSFRIGPFNTSGGGHHPDQREWSNSWHFMGSTGSNFPAFPKGVPQPQKVAVLGYTFAPVGADGTLVAQPPLHLHHATLITGFNDECEPSREMISAHA